MKNYFKNLSVEQLTKGGIIVGILGGVIMTAGDIVAKIKHDKREDKLYATLTVKAGEVSTNIFSNVDLLNEVQEKEEA